MCPKRRIEKPDCEAAEKRLVRGNGSSGVVKDQGGIPSLGSLFCLAIAKFFQSSPEFLAPHVLPRLFGMPSLLICNVPFLAVDWLKDSPWPVYTSQSPRRTMGIYRSSV